eukprot:Sdes_comp20518_c0_seq1m15088
MLLWEVIIFSVLSSISIHSSGHHSTFYYFILSQGASRVELCDNLMEGGVTPSVGKLKVIKRFVRNMPCFVMIRPRGGDFCYSDLEYQVMKMDIEALREAGADGFVFGILTERGEVDITRTRELLQLCHPLPVTFHRAFDMTADYRKSLSALSSVGVQRILTSGMDSSALDGLPILTDMVRICEEKYPHLIIVPAGGITERNVARILSCGAKEFHSSARTSSSSPMIYQNTQVYLGSALRPSEFSRNSVCPERVSKFVKIASAL